MPPTNNLDPSDLIPVDIVPEEYPQLFNKPSQWSWLMRRRAENGLSHAIVKIGERRMFLSRSRFSEWLAKQSEAI